MKTSISPIYLKGLQLAYPVTRSDSFEIFLLINADHYWDFVGDHTIRGNGPTAVSSKLGYLPSGSILTANPQQPRNTTNLVCMVTSHKQEEKDLQNLWSIESIVAFLCLLHSTQMNNFSRFTHHHLFPDGLYMARFSINQFQHLQEEDTLTSTMVISDTISIIKARCNHSGLVTM